MRHTSVSLLAPVLALSLIIAACGDDGDGDGANTSKAGASSAGSPTGFSGNVGESGAPDTGDSGAPGSGGRSGSSAGGSNTASAGRPSSGGGDIDGDTKLSEIDTEAEAEAACARAASALSEDDTQAILEARCTFVGLLAGALGQDCEDAKAECLAEEEPDLTSECSAQDFVDCDVTLDEYIACSTAQLNALSDLLGDLSCDSDLSAGSPETPATPAECVEVFKACPELEPTSGL